MGISIHKPGILKKTFLSVLCFFFFGVGMGQVTIRFQLPSSGLMLKSQLWNLSVVNSSSENLLVQVEVLLLESATNRRVFSGISKVLTLPRGITQLTPASTAPITYNLLSSEYNLGNGPDGLLPLGTYNVCFGVIKLVSDTKEKLAEECDVIVVEPLSPPTLITPGNEENIENKNPLFTWMAPGPISQFTDLLYEWKLVEIYGKQNPQSALQQNIPLWTQQNIKTTNLFYGNGLPQLDTSKRYAWQVTAINNRMPVASSEVWSFYLKNTSVTKIQGTPDFYIRLKRNEEDQFSLAGNKIKYAYNNEANDLTSTLVLYTLAGGSGRKKIFEFPGIPIHYGDNFLELDITSQHLTDKNFYLLELVNSRGERWCLKFKYRKSN